MFLEKDIYYLPPEYHKQSATLLVWPHDKNGWGDFNEKKSTLVKITQLITFYQTVLIIYFSASHYQLILSLLKKHRVNVNKIFFHQAQSDDIWIRDYGPLTVYKNNQLLLLKFKFNGWGDKYPYNNDNILVENLYKKNAFGDVLLEKIDMILEGGSIDVDGVGSALTTRRCLLEKNRNPTLNEKQIEDKLKRYLGITRVLWLDHGFLEGDDTDGHIDILARFTDPSTIVYMQCTDKKDSHFSELNAMEKQLKSWLNYEKKPYRLIPLPWPKPRYAKFSGHRLPVTYANFLIINNAVLVPVYDDLADIQALQQLRICFPQHTIIPINCLAILEGGGSLHCITMQIPQKNSVLS